jgi:AcrR family transcriptional regulator
MARTADPNARAALSNAARAEFVKKGLVGARIEDITQACGLSKGAFYLHYPSKEALFGEVVTALTTEIERIATERHEAMQQFSNEHGQLTPRDFVEHTPKGERYLALEVQKDVEILELLWAYRDVVDVLISGSQGTPFEGAVWLLVDRELQRIRSEFETLQEQRVCRPDMPAELLASLIVGTYLLLAKQMNRHAVKPDLETWALSLQRLMHEGTVPEATPRPRTSASRRVRKRRTAGLTTKPAARKPTRGKGKTT